MKELVLIAFSFLIGTLPFSYWIGVLFLQTDIRKIADGNPGCSNVYRTGKTLYGILAMVLDFSKGFFPAFYWIGRFSTVELMAGGIHIEETSAGSASIGSGIFSILFCVAPVLGHAFSPFLKFKGGKAVAVTFGVWTGLTLWVAPAFMGTVFLLSGFLIKVKEDGWRVMFGFASMPAAFLLTGAPGYYWGILLLNLLIVVYKHREDLAKPLTVSIRGKKWF